MSYTYTVPYTSVSNEQTSTVNLYNYNSNTSPQSVSKQTIVINIPDASGSEPELAQFFVNFSQNEFVYFTLNAGLPNSPSYYLNIVGMLTPGTGTNLLSSAILISSS